MDMNANHRDSGTDNYHRNPIVARGPTKVNVGSRNSASPTSMMPRAAAISIEGPTSLRQTTVLVDIAAQRASHFGEGGRD
jgi:hypothetical protein